MVTRIQLDEKTKQLVDTLEIISDSGAMREIAEALEDYESGKGKTLKQFRASR